MNNHMKSLKYYILGLIFNILYIIPITFGILLLLIFTFFRYFLGIYLSAKYGQKIHFISGQDTLFSLNDHEMVILGFLIIRGKLNLEEVRNRVKITLIDPLKPDGDFKNIKLRCTIKRSCGFFYWHLEESFCLEDHVLLYNCMPPKNDNELYEICTQISNEPLPVGRPPWLMYVLQLDKRYFAFDTYVIFIRCHHTITDAIAAVRVIGFCFFDNRVDTLITSRSYLKIRSKPHRHSKIKLMKSIFLVSYHMTKQLIQQDSNILHGPRLSGEKLCRMSAPVSLDRVKLIKAITDTTVNDVLMACIGGALRAHFELETAILPRKVHAALAVSFHTFADEPQFKNKCSSVTFKFNTEAASSLARLYKTNHRMKALKTELFLPINLICLTLVNLFPSCLSRLAMNVIGPTIILSNVPGPQMPCYSNGDIVERFGGFAPHISRTGIGISFFSFDGKLYIGMCVDKAIINNVNAVERFLKLCIEEINKLEQEIQMQIQLQIMR